MPHRLATVAWLVGLSALLGLSACDGAPDGATAEPAEPADNTGEFTGLLRPEVIVSGAALSGANGLHFGSDGLLYVASVIGSELVVMDPRDGEIHRRLTVQDGVFGPDDVAFGPGGAFFWTSILTGEVAGFDASGKRVVAGRPGPGVNPVTFSDDGRLFVAQCFFGEGVYELDPRGVEPPRLIADDLGPGCGLNGMDWGPDGRLYGPRWFHGEVVSLDVGDGSRRVEASGLQVPAAVKFDSQGQLHVLDTATGRILRVAEDGLVEVAVLEPGLDNFAFDARDQLYVSSFTDGFVARVEPDGRATRLLEGGLAHPGGVAVLPGTADTPAQVIVADLHALRGFEPVTGAPTFVERNILGVGPLGSVLSVAPDDANLILTAFTEDTVRVWDPVGRQVVARQSGLDQPVSAIRYAGYLVVAEHGAGRVVGFRDDEVVIFATDLEAPTGLATDGVTLYVTDRVRGRVFEIGRDGAPIPRNTVAKGLEAPEGIAAYRGDLIVVEGETGRVLRVAGETATPIALLAPGTPPAGSAQPPSMVFNGLAVFEDVLFVTGESNRVVYRIDLAGSMPETTNPE